MRVVYGAGAVAALSVMAAGMVQPDWTSTADPTDDMLNATNGPGLIAILPDGTDPGQSVPSGTAPGGAGSRARRVIHYIYLKPGQTAPPGATVIWATAPPPRTVRNHAGRPDPTATPRPRNNGGGNNGGGNNGGGNNGGGNNGGVVATPRPTAQATPRPTPAPTPKPTTRQSGQP